MIEPDAIRGRKAPHRRVHEDGCCLPAAESSCPSSARRLKIQRREARLDQRGLHPAALSRDFTIEQCDQNALSKESTRHDVGDHGLDRTGPWPGMPVTDMMPLMPCAIWSIEGRDV